MKILSGSALKLIACLSMLADHMAKFYLYHFPWSKDVLFTCFGKSFSFYQTPYDVREQLWFSAFCFLACHRF